MSTRVTAIASASASASSIGFGGLLTIAFIVLKLCHVINWSWWWVLSPLWITVAIYLLIVIIGLILIAKRNRKKSNRITNKKNRKK